MVFNQHHINIPAQAVNKMRRLFKIVISAMFAVIMVCIYSLRASAQSVNISTNIIPPYSPYYSDYYGANANKVLIILQNLTGNTLSVKLSGQITGVNNGIKISSYSSYVPPKPIVLAPHQTLQLGGLALKDIFDLNNLSVLGIDKGTLLKTSRLPEGDYNFCLQAYDYNKKVLLSQEAPLGCTSVSIQYPEAPILIGPVNKSRVYALNPQTVVFNWTNAGNYPAGTQYNIQLAEMPFVGGDPNQVLNAAALPMLNQTVFGFSYIYNALNVPLKVGSRYAWRVTASDPTGRVIFKNNGVSAASMFTYNSQSDINLSFADNPTDLFVISPACQDNNSLKNPIPVVIGEHNDLTISWLWADQINLLKSGKQVPESALSNYTQLTTAKGTVFIYKYKVDFKLVGIGKLTKDKYAQILKSGKAAFSVSFNSPNEYYSFKYADAITAGFAVGGVYTSNVTAYDSNNKEIGHAESCPWQLIDENQERLPKLNISGKLNYTYNSSYRGANNTSVTMQLVNTAQPKFSDNKSQLVSLDDSKAQVSFTTDSNGYFHTQLQLSAADTLNKFILFRINSPYYAPLQSNIAVKIPPLNYVVSKGNLVVKQDTLKLGDINTSVYNYSLKLNVKKGFPDKVTQADFDKEYGADSDLPAAQDVFIDNTTINSLATVPAGIPVQIFRKVKANDIPFYEGDGHAVENKSGRILIAQSTTTVQPNGKTIVNFNNLVANFQKGDEYYIQAILPKDDKNNADELTGPEQKYVYAPQLNNAQTFHYDAFTTYNIISTKPPTARIKGKVMYKWPSTPDVLHPYANQHFVVTMHVATNAGPATVNTNCQLYPSELRQNVNVNGKVVQMPFAAGPDKMVVAQGVTDAQGNFDLPIFDFMQMGDISGLTLVQTGPLYGPNCQEQQDAQKRAQQVAENGKNLNGAVATPIGINGNPVEGQIAGGDGGGVMRQVTGFGVEQNINQGLNLLNVANGEPAKTGIAAGVGGPSADDTSDALAVEPIAGKDKRTFTVDFADGSTPEFVVQPFGSIDLGVTTFLNDEIKDYPVKIYVNNSTSNEMLTGARVVVFRTVGHEGSKTPDGEGSISHPKKSLLSPNFAGGAKYGKYSFSTPVEWVIDTAFTIKKVAGTNYGTINLGNKRLWNKHEVLYSLQVCPNPEGDGGYFDPVLISLPIENFEKADFEKNDFGTYYEYSNSTYGSQKIGIAYTNKHIDYDAKGIYINATPSRLAGRVMDASSTKGLKNATIQFVTNGSTKTITTVDTSGYFEITNGQDGFTWADNAPVGMFVKADGFVDGGDSRAAIAAVGGKYYFTINLKPSASLFVETKDAVKKTNVPVYALRDDGTIFSQMPADKYTSPMIQMPVNGNVAHTITFYPIDPAYFEQTVTFYPNSYNKRNTVSMVTRHHRMLFNITDNNGVKIDARYTPLKIIINNDKTLVGKHEPNGSISFDFANVSVNNYNVQVVDTGGYGYIPIVFNLKNDESIQPVPYAIKMTKGLTLSGQVTLVKNNIGLPVKNARVYIDYNWQPDVSYGDVTQVASSALEARTLADGTYQIKGIPPHITGTGKLQVTMHATLDTNFMVVGDEKVVTLNLNGTNTASFAITATQMPLINKIWGFPLSVETMELSVVKGKQQYKVSGLVDLSSNTSQFTSFDPKNKVRVTDVIFVEGSRKGILIPLANSIPLDAVAYMKMRYLAKYNVVLKNVDNTKPLMLEKMQGQDERGMVNAMVSIVDNSFNYPSSYLSFQVPGAAAPIPFYLYEKQNGVKLGVPVINALNNIPLAGGRGSNTRYNLSDSAGNALKFSFIGFLATAAPETSFIDPNNGKFNLDVTLTGTVPHSNQATTSIHIKKLVLDGITIDKSVGDEPIIVNLQTWTLQVNNWTVDAKQGGIVSSDAYVKTGIVDIKAKTFNLRSDLFVLKDFDVSNISLGSGPVNLTNIDTAGTHLVFDEACGSDHGQHWRFAALNSKGGPVVASIPIPAVAGKTPAVNLDVSYFQLISFNNENIVSLSNTPTGFKLYNNNKFTFYPAAITSDNGSFTLSGAANIDVPRIGNMALNLVYTGPKASMDVNPGNFVINFEGKGYVQFTSVKNAAITPAASGYVTTILGSVQEPDKINPIPCMLSFGAPVNGGGTADNGTITLQKDYKLRMDGVSNVSANDDVLSISIANAKGDGMAVDGTNDWGTLKFSGLMNDPQSGALVKKPSNYSFEVLGDIQADADGITMDQATPLGNVHMTYTFATRTLYGILNMEDVQFGTYKFTGSVEMTYNPAGLVIVGVGSLNTGVLFADGFGIFNIGLLFGNATISDASIATVTKYSTAPENICWLKDNRNNFKGFFVTGGYTLINEHDGFNAAIAAIYFDAVLSIEASIGVNFAPATPSLIALVGAHGKVDAGLSSITGTTISGSLEAHLTADVTYNQSGFSLKANAGVVLKYTISQYVPFFGTQEIGGSKGAGVAFGVNPSVLKFSLDPYVGTVDCTATTYTN